MKSDVVASDATVTRHTLNNGLRVVIAQEKYSAVVGVTVHYGVGFRADPENISGLMHLLEHMMFERSVDGTENSLTYAEVIESFGGATQATTHQDYTEFKSLVPGFYLDEVLEFEASRMSDPRFCEDKLENQRNVVSEEIISTIIENPYGGFPWHSVSDLLYGDFGNRHNGYGSISDLENVTVDDCFNHFNIHCRPGNAVLTLVGDIDPWLTIEKVDRYFSHIPGSGSFVLSPGASEPVLEASRRKIVQDDRVHTAVLGLGYRLPNPVLSTSDYIDHLVLACLLDSSGRYGLGQSLVAKRELVAATSVKAGIFGSPFDCRDPDTLAFSFVGVKPKGEQDIISAFEHELEKLYGNVPGSDSLERVVHRMMAGIYREYGKVDTRSQTLGKFELLFGDAEFGGTWPRLMREVTPERVTGATRNILESYRVVVGIEPYMGFM